MGSLFSKPLTKEEMAEVKDLVEKIIAGNKIAVFSKSYCRK
jgi:septin family protein